VAAEQAQQQPTQTEVQVPHPQLQAHQSLAQVVAQVQVEQAAQEAAETLILRAQLTRVAAAAKTLPVARA
jgi:DNA-directed RNA polymerase subunit L